VKAVVLATGPSLKLYDGDHHGPVIALKRAACAYAADYAAILDGPTLKRLDAHLIGSPRVLTRGDQAHRTTRPVLIVEDMAEWCPLPFAEYTATAALVLAGYVGAEEVDVYGADWTDEPDWDGVEIPEQNRGPQRWERERRLWGEVTDWLGARGIEVTRMSPTVVE
jgi:hypothetical protein